MTFTKITLFSRNRPSGLQKTKPPHVPAPEFPENAAEKSDKRRRIQTKTPPENKTKG